ncbi:MAG: hypothetical protein ACK41Q_04375 [Candidatus Brocadia sp.]
MKRAMGFLILSLAILCPMSSAWAEKGKSDDARKAKLLEAYGKLPLYFIENKGQVDERVRFYEKGSGQSVFFTQDGVYVSLSKKEKSVNSKQAPGDFTNQKEEKFIGETAVLKPINANKAVEIVAEERLSGKVNYFIGNDPKKWRTDIPTYGKVRYKELYPGIDIVFYGNQRQLEYDIVIKPGADPSKVAFSYEGIKELKENKEGDLAGLRQA